MGKTTEMVEVTTKILKPYERSAKIHGAEQIEKLKDSIREFGFLNPCLIDKDYNIIAGHGRVMAAKELGMDKVPCVFVEGLTDEQRRAYILADNRLGELGEWDFEIVFDELNDLEDLGFNVELTGFDVPTNRDEWFEGRERFDDSREEGNDEYNEFLDKFEQPKTTDDCYTPDVIYDVVAEYVANRYKVKREKFVRPFYPGGDYQNEKYPKGCVVVDNPPFSILMEIVDFYVEKKQPFFLFAPGLSCLGYVTRPGVTAISTYAPITYENGANVPTSFITNLEKEDIAALIDADFGKSIETANEETLKSLRKHLPKFEFPDEVLTAARMGYLGKHGQTMTISRQDSVLIRTLDAMKEAGAHGIYGNALLLSEKKTEERVRAEKSAEDHIAKEKEAQEKETQERAASEMASMNKWKLSDREWEIVRSLGGGK